MTALYKIDFGTLYGIVFDRHILYVRSFEINSTIVCEIT